MFYKQKTYKKKINTKKLKILRKMYRDGEINVLMPQ